MSFVTQSDIRAAQGDRPTHAPQHRRMVDCDNLRSATASPSTQGRQMRRRQFITLVGSAAAVWSYSARAQQRMRRIGVLMAHLDTDPEFQDYLGAFREGLQKLGWTEGRNIQIDVRWGALTTRKGGNDRRRNLSPFGLISLFRKTRHQLQQCFSKRVRSLSFS